jgi:hypothetical protein
MTQEFLISILLGIVAFVGALMVKQLMLIATSVNKIQQELGILTNDHDNLKSDVSDIKTRITKMENK